MNQWFDAPDRETERLRRRLRARRPVVRWLDPLDAARYVGVTFAAVRKRWRTRGLRPVRWCGVQLLCVHCLDAWIDERQAR